MLIDGHSTEMEIDSGAGHTIVGRDTFNRIWPKGRKLNSFNNPPDIVETKARDPGGVRGGNTVPGQQIQTTSNSDGRKRTKPAKAKLVRSVGDLGERNILGSRRTEKRPLQPSIERYNKVFRQELGDYRGAPIKVRLDEGAKPLFRRYQPVPLALREKMKV